MSAREPDARPCRSRLGHALIAGALASASPWLAGQPADPSRGELLYSTHCIECHTTQMHWRDRRLARDWPTLRAQVSRWQDNANLNWTDEDIDAVTRYLNDTIYGFPRPQVGRAPPHGSSAEAADAGRRTPVR